jgi:glycosyltransferase involved in cell wall biosynthesis
MKSYRKRILLDASNALGVGAKIVIKNIISVIPKLSIDNHFIALLPDIEYYKSIPEYENLELIFLKQNSFRLVKRLFHLSFGLHNWLRVNRIDICFTLGDIGPIKMNIPHFVLLHQAYIVADAYDHISDLNILSKIKLVLIKIYFSRMIINLDAIFVQTPKMAEGLIDIYHLKKGKIFIIPQAIPQHIQTPQYFHHVEEKVTRFTSKGYVCFLFLGAAYEHKNHRVLPSVIKILKNRGIRNYKIIITLEMGLSKYESDTLMTLLKFKENIYNIGRIKPVEVASVLKQCDALFMPSTLESFGLIYIEAMSFNKPILASDRDFVHWICGDGIEYFEPNEPISIADSIEKFIRFGPDESYFEDYNKALASFPQSWSEVVAQYVNVMIE